jgi:acetyl-CoA acetyltransferase
MRAQVMGNLANRTAIAGIGATEFSKNSGRSELQLAVEAVTMALADAGIPVDELDGLCTFTMDNSTESEVFRAIGGKDLKFFSRTSAGGGGGCGAVLHAMMAVTSGVCDVCVVYRGMNERSEYRFGQPMAGMMPTAENALFAYHAFHGLQTAASMMAMSIRRYMHDYGAGAEDFATLAVTSRKHAATNPQAFFYGKPITREDYLGSRMVSDPLRLLDCCQESDGAVALAIVGADRARALRQRPVMIRGGAQASARGTNGLLSYCRDDIAPYDEVKLAADQLYAMSGLSPRDMQAAIIYDHFLPSILPGLEAYGFCGRGEAKDFIKGGAIEIGGRLPLNTNGGQVGEAYIHGLNGIAEAVRQVRGTAVNQVAHVENILVTSGSGVPTSGLILGTA